MSKQITYGDDSRQAILRGVNRLADAVRVTLVPPSPLPFLRKRLAVTARATARRPAWDR